MHDMNNRKLSQISCHKFIHRKIIQRNRGIWSHLAACGRLATGSELLLRAVARARAAPVARQGEASVGAGGDDG